MGPCYAQQLNAAWRGEWRGGRMLMSFDGARTRAVERRCAQDIGHRMSTLRRNQNTCARITTDHRFVSCHPQQTLRRHCDTHERHYIIHALRPFSVSSLQCTQRACARVHIDADKGVERYGTKINIMLLCYATRLLRRSATVTAEGLPDGARYDGCHAHTNHAHTCDAALARCEMSSLF